MKNIDDIDNIKFASGYNHNKIIAVLIDIIGKPSTIDASAKILHLGSTRLVRFNGDRIGDFFAVTSLVSKDDMDTLEVLIKRYWPQIIVELL